MAAAEVEAKDWARSQAPHAYILRHALPSCALCQALSVQDVSVHLLIIPKGHALASRGSSCVGGVELPLRTAKGSAHEVRGGRARVFFGALREFCASFFGGTENFSDK
jgi:hypothetical protein